jgi:DNA polymerase elongation subunit (family B)
MKMSISKLPVEKILFLDIETVPEVYEFKDLDTKTAELYQQKASYFLKDGATVEDVYQRAGIYAEFGKIVCISCGLVRDHAVTGKSIRMKSFASDDERELLLDFKKLLNDLDERGDFMLCGHNAKEFDFPFIARRMLIHGIQLPKALDIAGKKPWEISHLDTMDLWKFGDYKNFTSLALLCHIFKIPTPKDDISGADVARVYYEENDLKRIAVYCEKDVVALIQLFLKMQGRDLVPEEKINFSL